MTYLTSHSNSINERNERRRNWKNDIAQSADAQNPALTVDAAKRKFGKLAKALVAGGKVTGGGNYFQIAVGAGKKFYPVYKIKDSFCCDSCADRVLYGFCAHEAAAAAFAAKTEAAAQSEAAMTRLIDRRTEHFIRD